MNESEKLLSELKDIRNIMERSSRFLSLSGLSGILVGIYALVGAFFANRIVHQFPYAIPEEHLNDVLTSVFVIGITVLILSLFTIYVLTVKQAKKEQKPIWGPGSKLLLINLLIPLATGGILTTILALRGYYGIVSPCFLIFYGLALVNAAKYTRPEILSLGLVEIVLGLLAATFPGYGLYFWAIGFGILHIIYGFMFLNRENKNSEA
ncbi:hypothetical protein SAMN05444285_11323 [Draconibacterium orientale]|uniref:Membrane protein n=1 Tax=Draconibacterium orientale TaxID=1168034 RepID=X5DZ41_9BACT|nr:hypothetical protein [Draconibacterium orientale]AHW60505.1 membrane protein [Draconibacterium orientale]SET43850.1 hypothetical protein SAMN05444285_11323 [Draconibacterium orientale]